jgi:hypothetical protein
LQERTGLANWRSSFGARISKDTSPMEHTIIAFLKFGSYYNILDAFENGTIYLNTAQYFRGIEDNELRGDKFEGASRIVNSLPGTFQILGIEGNFNYIKAHYVQSYPEILGNIYSLYCISSHGFSDPLSFSIDERNSRFGTHCLLIKDCQYFLNKIQEALINSGRSFTHGFIEYYNKETISKDLTLFEKPNEFEYQKEFRFYVANDKLEPIKIRIGSLQNYAQVITIEEAMAIRLTPK